MSSDGVSSDGVSVQEEPGPDGDEVVGLYRSVGWTAYTSDPARLLRGIAASHLVLTARTPVGDLVGLARTLSDGETACYLQDLLVRPAHQGSGVGRALLEAVLDRYRDVRFVGLTTDAEGTAGAEGVHAFYRAAGLLAHADLGLAAFARP